MIVRRALTVLIVLSALASPAARTASGQATADHREVSELSLLYDSGTGGYSMPLPNLDDRAVEAALLAAGLPLLRTDVGFEALVSGANWFVQRSGGLVALRARDDLDDGVARTELPVLVAPGFAAFAWPPDRGAAVLARLEAAMPADGPRPTRREGRAFERADGLRIELPGATTPPPTSAGWEVRMRTRWEGEIDGRPIELFVVARLAGEGARRAALLVDELQGGSSMYVSSGDVTEGRSFLAGAHLSLHRPVSWLAMSALSLRALSPGVSELLAGVAGLRAEAEAAGVDLVSSNLSDRQGAALFPRWLDLSRGGRRLLVLGYTDPASLAALPADVRNTVRARSIDAVMDALDERLNDGALPPPDLVVLLGSGQPDEIARVRGVDVVLLDRSIDTRYVRRAEAAASLIADVRDEAPRAREPMVFGRCGPRLVCKVTARWDRDGALLSLEHRALPVPEDLSAEPELIAQVQAIRQKVYADGEAVLVPAPSTLPRGSDDADMPDALDEAGFARLAGNLMLARTGADLALLRPLPAPLSVPGDRLELTVDASLSVLDRLVVVELTGAQLKALFARLPSRAPGSAGPPPDGRWVWLLGARLGKGLTVRGRTAQDADRLRVVTTDDLTEDSEFASAFPPQARRAGFRGAGFRRDATRRGPAWTLHDLVRGGLETLRAIDPSFGEAYAQRIGPLLLDTADRLAPQATLDVDKVGLQVTGSKAAGDRAGFDAVNESRVHQFDSIAATLRGRIALSWDDAVGSLVAFTQGALSRDKPPGVPWVDLEDDWVVGGEARLRARGVRTRAGAPIPLSWFAQAVFDSEFLRNRSALGEKLPRQALLRGSGGVQLGRVAAVKEARTGFFVEEDLAVPGASGAPGALAAVSVETVFGPVKLQGLADFRGYFPGPWTDAADLAFRLNLRGDLLVEPARYLLPGFAFGAFADTLVFHGAQVGINDRPGLHLLVGGLLTWDVDLRPPLRFR